ncbi:hypothetical protein L227DRAFT_189794 [Lentinus tigrinus ALCF2SS1-6]|uniref:Uncharacterized protein n=1 Tax=Lentinus tigrinus ALCF2SS1-6 TaxID=1328759 RepID=A0A5C2S3U5_9APHY|nr:hypothetical protein L227DRAFT_189794 [Lentinus tigrinus ALCF2SS1-6]
MTVAAPLAVPEAALVLVLAVVVVSIAVVLVLLLAVVPVLVSAYQPRRRGLTSRDQDSGAEREPESTRRWRESGSLGRGTCSLCARQRSACAVLSCRRSVAVEVKLERACACRERWGAEGEKGGLLEHPAGRDRSIPDMDITYPNWALAITWTDSAVCYRYLPDQ